MYTGASAADPDTGSEPVATNDGARDIAPEPARSVAAAPSIGLFAQTVRNAKPSARDKTVPTARAGVRRATADGPTGDAGGGAAHGLDATPDAALVVHTGTSIADVDDGGASVFDADGGRVRSADGGDSEAGPLSEAQTEQFLTELFARRDEFLERDRFATIGEASEFFTKIVGVTFEGRQARVAGLREGDALELVRDPGNVADPNAIAVHYGMLHVGYIRKEIVRRLAPKFDEGVRYEARVASVTGGGAKNVGINIFVHRLRSAAAVARRNERDSLTSTSLTQALIGNGQLREPQTNVLARVEAGYNTLAVFGTGRGKSFCFQLPAAQRALANGGKTLVFYPLRALTNDQREGLVRRLRGTGLRILRANGSIDAAEREDLERALEDGSWDIILATPEFVQHHRARFARPCNRPWLVVVDEAHHLFESRHREAYTTLGPFLREELGGAQILALTATARKDVFKHIQSVLGIERWVIDPTIRTNLHVVDARETRDKLSYIASTVSEDGKAIVYCNSRSEAAKVAEGLRGKLGNVVAFYHAGMGLTLRSQVEQLFRAGSLRVVVATSAFGEGIDLPDVRDVYLYHLNFSYTEFNQQAGRVGRDGVDARIHLLYGKEDRRINDYIIAHSAPSLGMLRQIYRGMRDLAGPDGLRLSARDISDTLGLDMADERTISIAQQIFADAGLVETGIDDDGRYSRFLAVDGKVDITQTARFAEGEAERENFERFCGLALEADAAALESVVNRPIYPDRIELVR